MGRSTLQFSGALPAKESLALRSVSQSATKLGSSGSGTATLSVHDADGMMACAATEADTPATIQPLITTAAQMRGSRTILSVGGTTSAASQTLVAPFKMP